jgi:hypothetical protein
VPASAPSAVDGPPNPAAAPAAVLPNAVPEVPVDDPGWEELAPDTQDALSHADTARRRGRKSRSWPRHRSGVTPAQGAPRARLWGVLGGVSLAAMLALGFLLAWFFSPTPTPPVVPGGQHRPTLVVNSTGKPNTFRSLREALQRVVQGPKDLGARILVQTDLAEADIQVVGTRNVSIEANASKPVVWKFASRDKAALNLLALNNAEGFRLKGFILDGDNQAKALVNLYGHCPGVILEDLTFHDFKEYGVWVTNCEGGPGDRKISLSRLHFLTARADQTAIFFEILGHGRDIVPKNRFFSFRDCTFDGPGKKIKAGPNAIDPAELPPDLKPLNAP